MNQKTQPAQRALPLEPGNQIVREGHSFERLPEHEFPGVQDEGLAVRRRHQLGQVLHRLAHVDVGVARVVEHAELAIDPDIHARGLHQALVVWLDDDAAGVYLGPDAAVAEYHGGSSLMGQAAQPAEPAACPTKGKAAQPAEPAACPTKGKAAQPAEPAACPMTAFKFPEAVPIPGPWKAATTTPSS